MDTDNQQQTVSDLEVGWLAGIIEGEGTIGLQIHKRKGRNQQMRVTPRVIISNTDKEIIEKCVNILDGIGVGKWVHMTRANNKKVSSLFALNGADGKRYRDMHQIQIDGFKRLRLLLPAIRPALFGEKRHRADILLRLISNRMAKCKESEKASNISYDEEDVKTMLEFVKITKSPNYDKIAGMLNEHTREARLIKRREYKANYSRQVRSRCALDSLETARFA